MTKPDSVVPGADFFKLEDGSIIGTPSSNYGVMLPLLSPVQNQSLKENLREVQTFLRFWCFYMEYRGGSIANRCIVP